MVDGSQPPVVAPAGFATDASARAAAILAERVQQLYRLSQPAYIGTLLGALAAVAALWYVTPLAGLIGWGVAAFAVTAARYALYRAYMKATPPHAEAPRWSAYFVAGAAASGIVWGVLGSALYPAGWLPHEVLLILIICGMAVASILTLASMRHAFLAFLLPAMLPLVPTVFLQGTAIHWYMGVLVLVFLVVMLASGPVVSEMIGEAIGMKFENSELLARLSETHATSRMANLQLNEQVYAQRVTAEQLRQASQKLAALIEASPLAIIVRDIDGRIETWNTAAELIFGWTQEEVRGTEAPYYPPGTDDEGALLRRRILAGETVSGLEAVRVRKDGKMIDVSMSASLVYDLAGRPTGYLTMIADITERTRAAKQQNAISQISMLLSDAQTVEDAIPRVLETVCESFGFVYGARWVLDRQNLLLRCAETWSVPSEALNAFREQARARVERPGRGEGLHSRVWASGAPLWLSDLTLEKSLPRFAAAADAGLRCAFGFPIMVSGEFYGMMEFFGPEARAADESVMQVAQNVSAHIGQFIARKQAERNLQFVASHDALTGLLNRSMFSQRLQQALAQAHRHDRQLAVLFIDLDGFKLINDMLGHDAGDVLLADLANRLRDCMREGDTLGRMGGDEFVVLIEGYREETQLLDVARKVLETVAHPFLLRDGSYNVTASIGIAAYPHDGRDAPELLKNADIAMYRAKERGKNNFQFYSAEMNTHLVERVSMENALRRALEKNELTLFYQPRMSLRDNKVIGLEALVRWVHPTQGLLTPSEFVPIAEDTGLYSALGDWILHTAALQLRQWQQRGLNGLRMAINISTRQFAQDSLIERLREAVYNAGIEPRQLEIEVTEATLMRHAERAGKLLSQVKELGALIVIDDFGTGYSSLGCLKRFPIDAVKIDRSLIAQLPAGADAAGVSRAVIAMAQSLGLEVTAEGVETRPQCDFLTQYGCDAMQGNYLCAPAPADTVGAMLLQQPMLRSANVQQFRPWRTRPGPDAPGQ
ncbi:MAG: EAL domain-containing protein [Burkholderiales bacterium]